MDNYYDIFGYIPVDIDSKAVAPYIQYPFYREVLPNTADQPGNTAVEIPLGTTKNPIIGVSFRVSFIFTDLLSKFSSISPDSLSAMWKPTFSVLPPSGLRTSVNLTWDTTNDNYALVKSGTVKNVGLYKPYTLYTNVYSKENLDAMLSGPAAFSIEKTASSSYDGVKLGILGVDILIRRG